MSLLRELLTEEVQEYVIYSTDAPHYRSERAGEHVLGIKVKKTYTDKKEAEKHAKVLSDAGPRRYKVGPARKRMDEAEEKHYVIHKKTRSPGKISSVAGMKVDGVEIKRVYTDKSEAEKHAKMLDKHNPVGYQVSLVEDAVNEAALASPKMKGDAHARKMAEQFVSNAIKHFDDKEELQAAKRMAKGFYSNLVKHIDNVYAEMKSDVEDTTDKE